jgi:flagellar biosynthesis/type III secretory pathway chaperone
VTSLPLNEPQLVGLLASAQTTLRSLIDVLIEEQRLLARCDAAGLEESSNKKQDALTRLENWLQQWKACLREAGFSMDPSTLSAWMVAQDYRALHQAWKKFQLTLQAFRLNNDINGRLIERQLSSVDLRYTALRTSGHSPELYSPNGAIHRDVRLHKLV